MNVKMKIRYKVLDNGSPDTRKKNITHTILHVYNVEKDDKFIDVDKF